MEIVAQVQSDPTENGGLLSQSNVRYNFSANLALSTHCSYSFTGLFLRASSIDIAGTIYLGILSGKGRVPYRK
jgi:hypothetical protein